jgi:hypothetical protein
LNGGSEKANSPLATATAVVGLLAGLVAVVYVVGGLVIALRMLFDHFSLGSTVTIVGQLPRELVVTTAMLDVLLPAFVLGLLVALATVFVYLVRGLPSRTTGRPRLGRLEGVLLVVVAAALVSPAIANVIADQGLTATLLTSLLGLVVTAVTVLAAWFGFRAVARGDWPLAGKLLAAGGMGAAVALTPAVMFAASLDFEQALVCTTASQIPEKGELIGEGGGKVLLENEFGTEASVLSLSADGVTKTEFGDLSSIFACPPPPGTPATPPTEIPKLGGHGSEEEVRLATQLRPRLRFDSSEPWRPIAVDSFLAEDFEGEHHGACQAGENPPCPAIIGIAELSRREDAPAYIDIHGRARNGEDFGSPEPGCRLSPPARDCNSGPAAVIYYRRTTHEGRWYWDYWWFLRYNDYKGKVNHCTFICGDHEGDWEGVTVITTPSLTPEIVGTIYAAHKDRILVDGSTLPAAGGHPLVWVASGTHASYPFDCDGGCKQYNRLPEDPHDGAIPWGGNREKECEERDCVRPLPEIGVPADVALPAAGAWAGWGGKWGETCHKGCKGVFKHQESSPASPGLQVRFQCPWVPTRRAQPAPDGSGLSDSEATGDRERLLALCLAQRGGG